MKLLPVSRISRRRWAAIRTLRRLICFGLRRGRRGLETVVGSCQRRVVRRLRLFRRVEGASVDCDVSPSEGDEANSKHKVVRV